MKTWVIFPGLALGAAFGLWLLVVAPILTLVALAYDGAAAIIGRHQIDPGRLVENRLVVAACLGAGFVVAWLLVMDWRRRVAG